MYTLSYANTLIVGGFLVAIAKAVNKVKISGVARVLRHATPRRRGGWASSYPVSYTHLTLPTIYSV